MTDRKNVRTGVLVFPLVSVGLLSFHVGLLYMSAPDGARRKRELRFAAGALRWHGAWTVF